MLTVRRLIETPAGRRYAQIDIRDFMMDEKELASKYGVPWHAKEPANGFAVLAVGALLAGICLFSAFAGKGA